jgi:hypothetical protein
VKPKTDNTSLAEKCKIRRLLIREAKLEPCRVLDLFAGYGAIWGELRSPQKPEKPIEVTAYTPVDQEKRQDGQIQAKITPALIGSLNGDESAKSYDGTGLLRFNCIDIDTYGEPWEIWDAVLFRIKQRTAVFLTRGRAAQPGKFADGSRREISKHAKRAMGIPEDWNVPCRGELMDFADRCQLLVTCPTAKIKKGYELRHGQVDYYAVLVEPVSG